MNKSCYRTPVIVRPYQAAYPAQLHLLPQRGKTLLSTAILLLTIGLGSYPAYAAQTSISSAPNHEQAPPADAPPAQTTVPSTKSSPASTLYACPMHPQQTSHQPGRCPICNMFLTPQQPAEHNHDHANAETQQPTSNKGHTHNLATVQLSQPKPLISAPAAAHATHQYVCPMHPQIVSDEAGTCPICGMNLERVELEAQSSEEISINVSGDMQQALALRTAPVKRGTLWKYVRTVGEVEYDQGQISHIHARVNGWIETLKVQSAGEKITKGQLLYEIYSPELINAQDDYLLALATLKQSRHSSATSDSSQSYQELVRKAGLRLELLGLTQQQIQHLADSGKTRYRVPFYAKQDGVVKALNVREGMYIQPQTEMMSLVDLSRVWVIADVFENQQSWLAVGQEAEISLPALNIRDIKGRVDYIYPELDPVTRSLRVRIVLDNPKAALRPNTLARVALFGGAKRQALTIPREALIQTGKANRVIIKQADNRFSVRQVKVGMQSQGKAEIISGLELGEQVVISGQFLLDSEASLKGSLLRLSSPHNH